MDIRKFFIQNITDREGKKIKKSNKLIEPDLEKEKSKKKKRKIKKKSNQRKISTTFYLKRFFKNMIIKM